MSAVFLAPKVFCSPQLGGIGPKVLGFLSADQTAKIQCVSKSFIEMTAQIIEHQLVGQKKIDFCELAKYRQLLKLDVIDILNKMPALEQLDSCPIPPELRLSAFESLEFRMDEIVSKCKYKSNWKQLNATFYPAKFAVIAKECPSLEYYSQPTSGYYPDMTNARLLSIAQSLPNLKSLEIGYYGTGDFDADGINGLIKSCPKLERLKITAAASLPKTTLAAITSFATQLKSLELAT